ncbi:hypothetical protein PCE1_000809 [Barthelona sp. PCE]
MTERAASESPNLRQIRKLSGIVATYRSLKKLQRERDMARVSIVQLCDNHAREGEVAGELVEVYQSMCRTDYLISRTHERLYTMRIYLAALKSHNWRAKRFYKGAKHTISTLYTKKRFEESAIAGNEASKKKNKLTIDLNASIVKYFNSLYVLFAPVLKRPNSVICTEESEITPQVFVFLEGFHFFCDVFLQKFLGLRRYCLFTDENLNYHLIQEELLDKCNSMRSILGLNVDFYDFQHLVDLTPFIDCLNRLKRSFNLDIGLSDYVKGELKEPIVVQKDFF